MADNFTGLEGTLGDQPGDYDMPTTNLPSGWWNQLGLGGTLGDQPGDYDMPTNPQTPGAFGNWANQLSQAIKNSGLTGQLKNFFNPQGALGPIPLLGLAALANRSDFFNAPATKVGFQGTIPQYTATRQQLPYQTGQANELLRLKQAAQDAMSTGATQDQVRGAALRTYGISPSQFDQAMQTEGTYRRPGLGGITYFSPMQYSTGAPTTPTAGGGTQGGTEGGISDLVDRGERRRPLSASGAAPATAASTPGFMLSTSTGAQSRVPATASQSATPTTTPGRAVGWGPNATPVSSAISARIRDAYQKAGLPEDPTTWTMDHKRMAVDINNEIRQLGPYDRLIFNPETGGVDRPDPQVFSTLEPERKAAAEAYLKSALPNAVGLVRAGVASQGSRAIERLLKDYRLSLDEAASFLSPEDAATLRREVGVGNISYAKPGRSTYYGALAANAPQSDAFQAGIAALGKGRPGAAAGSLTERDKALRQLLSTYSAEQGSEYLKQFPAPYLKKLGAPDWVWKYSPSFDDVFKAEASANPDEYWRNFARQKAADQQVMLSTIVDTVGGVPIYKPTNPRNTPRIGTSFGDVKQLQTEFGFTPQEVLAAESAYNKYGLGDLSNQIDPQIANAVRDSLQAGFTMDQIYQGAEKNLGISKDRLNQALKAMNMAGTDISPEDVIRMARENLPPPHAAAGGYMPGGIAMLAKGRYLKGNGDGVSDSIPARFAGSGQEARLADGEFVVPARVVSELGNGSSDAGARKLYAMLDRVEARAKKAKRGKPSGADRELNKLA